jgi:hypothetical protein
MEANFKNKINSFQIKYFNLPFSFESFHLKIAIEFLPTQETNHYQGGHYTFWVPMNDKWMRISDSFYQIYNTLPNYLSNIYFLIFERIIN